MLVYPCIINIYLWSFKYGYVDFVLDSHHVMDSFHARVDDDSEQGRRRKFKARGIEYMEHNLIKK